MAKVQELTGALLNHWSGKADGLERRNFGGNPCFIRVTKSGDEFICFESDYSPSTDWAQGGPIIEKEQIRWQPTPLHKTAYFCWNDVTNELDPVNGMHGDSLLQAAMRCFVASKYGDEVPDES